MARFVVFGGSNYYPSGGFRDFLGEASTLAEAERLAVSSLDEMFKESPIGSWAHIVDTSMRVVVWDASMDRDRLITLASKPNEPACQLARPS